MIKKLTLIFSLISLNVISQQEDLSVLFHHQDINEELNVLRALGRQADDCDLLSYLNTTDLKAEIALLAQEPFIAISLGANCFPAMHLRNHNIRARSFPFDWNIMSVDAICAILENDFKGYLDLKNLSISDYTVTNHLYNFRFMHDFDRDDWTNGPEGLTPTNSTSLPDHEKIISYYQRRIARFYSVFTLNAPIYLFRREINSDEAQRLQAILRKKFPQSNFKLVCIEEGHHESEKSWRIPDVIRFKMNSAEAPFYAAGQRNAHWTRVFSSLGLLRN